MSERGASTSRHLAALGAALIAGCLALAALSLLAPSIPSYDPFAWIVWGRQLTDHAQTFSVDGGPSWKPLPVLFTVPFSLAGSASPSLWLVVARAGGLLALAGAFSLGMRLAGAWAGLVALVGVLLTQQFAELSWRGASEPLLLACVLWAIERHLAGRRGTAFALAVAAALIRPEAWPFLGLYALWRWRGAGGRERVLMLGGLALVPLLWVGPPALGGDPLAASSHAANYNGRTGSDPAWTAFRRGLEQAVVPVWLLALAAVALRPRDRIVRTLALGAGAWLLLVVVMTVAGYPGLGRFMLPAAAIACVLAGVGAVALVARAGASGRAAAALAIVVLLAAGAALTADRAHVGVQEMRIAIHAADVQHQLTQAIAAAGGRVAVLACGSVAVNHTAQTALAWKLHARLDRVSPELHKAGIVFRGPKQSAIGAPAAITVGRPRHTVFIARAGVWRVAAVLRDHRPLPAGCGPRA
jgi:hypothetical protein